MEDSRDAGNKWSSPIKEASLRFPSPPLFLKACDIRQGEDPLFLPLFRLFHGSDESGSGRHTPPSAKDEGTTAFA